MSYVRNELLRDEIDALKNRVDAAERVLAKLAHKAGLIPTVDEPAAPKPSIARGTDAIERFKAELYRHFDSGRSWDQSVDLIDATLFQAAVGEFALTVGRGGAGGRSVTGFKERMVEDWKRRQAAPQEEQAA